MARKITLTLNSPTDFGCQWKRSIRMVLYISVTAIPIPRKGQRFSRILQLNSTGIFLPSEIEVANVANITPGDVQHFKILP